MKIRKSAIVLSLLASATQADHKNNIQEITIEGDSNPLSAVLLTPESLPASDSGELLKLAPGANLNSNGPITGIAQYRGMFGDRVSIHIDNAPVLTGGPNAMDAPLSYASPGLLKELVIHRGIAPVSAGQETLGGHIDATLNRGSFAIDNQSQLSGFIDSGFADNGERSRTTGQLVAASKHNKFAAIFSHEEGNDLEASDNKKITGTHFQRDRYDISYGWQYGATHGEIFYGRLDTSHAGTPALPMDIGFIDTDQAGLKISSKLSGAEITAQVNWTDVEHEMNNFEFRMPPMNGMMYRSNFAQGDSVSWSLQSQWKLESGKLTIGQDGNVANHEATISNPNNAMFEVLNFNGVERNGLGLFAEWNQNLGDWNIDSGIRFNRITLDSDPIGASGLMGMMGMAANTLATQFNAGDLKEDYDYIDLVVKLSRPLSDTLRFKIDLGRKNRAPTYQERYLWLPLPATGGLADGRSYTGNLNLDEETAHEIDLGLEWTNGKFSFAPQAFYRRIDDYIQGTPSTDMTANMVSTMMSGNGALTFSNIDAEIYGVDANWRYQLSNTWIADGVFSYVRGKRRDTTDNLYRIAPLNARIALHYQTDTVQVTVESVLYSKQDDVSAFNNEQESAGYGIINLSANWRATSSLQIRSGVRNLFDKAYTNHLGGYNRNGFSDVALGARIPGLGREAYIAAQYRW